MINGVASKIFNPQKEGGQPVIVTQQAKSRVVPFRGVLYGKDKKAITSKVKVIFRLYNSQSDGKPLWTSKTWDITPNANGEFSLILGNKDQGDIPIPANLFYENAALFMGVAVGGGPETDPRLSLPSVASAAENPERSQVPIVDWAPHADLLRGYPPSLLANPNTIPVINSEGKLILASPNAAIESTSGEFSLVGQTLSIAALNGAVDLNSNVSGGTAINITAPNLSSGVLLYGNLDVPYTVADLIQLAAQGKIKFSVDANGNIFANGDFKTLGNIEVGGQVQLGSYSAPPVPKGIGSIYYNSTGGGVYVWNGTAWIQTLGFTGITGPTGPSGLQGMTG
ncbi:MAG: hypothetical protein ACD_24C00302G0001, partial [uncultured bacterium]